MGTFQALWPDHYPRDRSSNKPLIDHFREAAQGGDDIRTECAGVIAGSWFADTARRGEELIAAGMLMLVGHTDLDELDKWLCIGWERRRGRHPSSDSKAVDQRAVWPSLGSASG